MRNECTLDICDRNMPRAYASRLQWRDSHRYTLFPLPNFGFHNCDIYKMYFWRNWIQISVLSSLTVMASDQKSQLKSLLFIETWIAERRVVEAKVLLLKTFTSSSTFSHCFSS